MKAHRRVVVAVRGPQERHCRGGGGAEEEGNERETEGGVLKGLGPGWGGWLLW